MFSWFLCPHTELPLFPLKILSSAFLFDALFNRTKPSSCLSSRLGCLKNLPLFLLSLKSRPIDLLCFHLNMLFILLLGCIVQPPKTCSLYWFFTPLFLKLTACRSVALSPQCSLLCVASGCVFIIFSFPECRSVSLLCLIMLICSFFSIWCLAVRFAFLLFPKARSVDPPRSHPNILFFVLLRDLFFSGTKPAPCLSLRVTGRPIKLATYSDVTGGFSPFPLRLFMSFFF